MSTSRNGEKPVMLVGLLRLRGHCTFSWREPEGGGRRAVEVQTTHCEACVAELRERGYRIVYVRAEHE
jgi:hypothetical protein